MKKFVAIFLFLLIALTLYSSSFFITGDLRSFDFFFQNSLRVDSVVGMSIKDTNIIFPLRYGMADSVKYIETGVLLDVFPFEGYGFFAEVSLVKIGYIWGSFNNNRKFLLSQEASLGWQFQIGIIMIRPKYTVRSLFSGEESKEETIKAITQFSESRIGINIGLSFGGKNEKQEVN